MAIKWVKEINLIDHLLDGSSADDMAEERTYWDPSQYSGTVALYHEAVGYTNDPPKAWCSCVYKDGTYIESTYVCGSATSWERQRSGNIISYLSTAGEIKTASSNDGSTTSGYVRADRFIIVQSHASAITDTESQIEIGSYELNLYGGTLSDLAYPKVWYYNSANWDGTVQGYAEAVWSVNNDKYGVAIYLYKSTDQSSWSLAATIISNGTSETPYRSRVSFTLENGYYYKLRYNASGTKESYGANIYCGKIIVNQTDATEITKTETTRLLISYNQTATGLLDLEQYYDPDNEWDGVTFDSYHEVVLSDECQAKLQEDPNGTPADITNSAITSTTLDELLRGGSAMTMPSSAEEIDAYLNDVYAGGVGCCLSRIVHIITVGAGATYKDFAGTSALVASTPSADVMRYSNWSGTAALVGSTPNVDLLRLLPFAGVSGLQANTPNASLLRILPFSGSSALVVNCPDCDLSVVIFKSFNGTSALVLLTQTADLLKYANYAGSSNLGSDTPSAALLRYANYVGSSDLATSVSTADLLRILPFVGAAAIQTESSSPDLLRILGFSGVADLVISCPDCDLQVIVIKNFSGTSALVTTAQDAALLRFANYSGSSDISSAVPDAALLRILTFAGDASLVTSTTDADLLRILGFSGLADLVTNCPDCDLSVLTGETYKDFAGQVALVTVSSLPDLLRVLSFCGVADLVTVCPDADLKVLGAPPSEAQIYTVIIRRRRRA